MQAVLKALSRRAGCVGSMNGLRRRTSTRHGSASGYADRGSAKSAAATPAAIAFGGPETNTIIPGNAVAIATRTVRRLRPTVARALPGIGDTGRRYVTCHRRLSAPKKALGDVAEGGGPKGHGKLVSPVQLRTAPSCRGVR
jgi:hypothetical protein